MMLLYGILLWMGVAISLASRMCDPDYPGFIITQSLQDTNITIRQNESKFLSFLFCNNFNVSGQQHSVDITKYAIDGETTSTYNYANNTLKTNKPLGYESTLNNGGFDATIVTTTDLTCEEVIVRVIHGVATQSVTTATITAFYTYTDSATVQVIICRNFSITFASPPTIGMPEPTTTATSSSTSTTDPNSTPEPTTTATSRSTSTTDPNSTPEPTTTATSRSTSTTDPNSTPEPTCTTIIVEVDPILGKPSTISGIAIGAFVAVVLVLLVLGLVMYRMLRSPTQAPPLIGGNVELGQALPPLAQVIVQGTTGGSLNDEASSKFNEWGDLYEVR